MGITTYYAAIAANKTLSNLAAPTEVSAALLPGTNNTYDFGADAARWVNGYFGGVLTCYDLVVESGSSIKLAGATFENRGHYTSVDTNFGVRHDDSATAFFAIYAENTSAFTHANLLLDAQGSALNMVKNSPSHMFAPGMAGITNEDGNFGIFVDHDSEISFQHFDELTKDEYGNITNMTGMQTLARITDDHLYLEAIDLEIHEPEGSIKVLLSKDTDCYINSGHGLCIGGTDPGYDVMLKVNGYTELDDVLIDNGLFISAGFQGLFIYRSNDNNLDLLCWQAGTEYGEFEFDASSNTVKIDHTLRLWNDHADYGGVLWLEESNNAPTVAETGSGHQLWAGSDHQLYWMDQTGNSVTLGAWTVPGTEGITYDPGSDTSVNIFTVNVSGGLMEPLWQYDWTNDVWMTTRPIAMSGWAQGSPFRWLYAADGSGKTELWTSNTTPEGAIDTTKGALAVDYTEGDLYIKTTANGASGWEKFDRNLWSRSDTTLTPTNNGDDVNFTGNILLDAGAGTNYGIRIGQGDDLYIGNDDSLVYDRVGGHWIVSEGDFSVGYWGVGGDLRINAEDGGTVGAKCRVYVGGDYDDDIEYYVFKTVEDDLYIGPNIDTDALKFTGSGAAVTAAFNVDLAVNGTISGADATNWNTAYGWGDHAGLYDGVGTANSAVVTHETTYNHAAYLTTETDPIFSAWDKSTGISITESQISDLDHFSGDLPDLHSAGVDEVAFGGGLGDGLTTSSSFTYDGSKLTVGAGGLVVDRAGASYVQWKRDGSPVGQIRATTANTLAITTATGSADLVTINCVNGYIGVGPAATDPEHALDVDGDVKVTGDLGVGVTPTKDFHVEKDVVGVVTSRIYNTNAEGITEHLVGATGGGHLVMIANSTGSSHYSIPGGSVGLATTWGNKFTIAVGDGNNASEMMQFNGAIGTTEITGNLGVGTAPSHKLDVSGTISTDTRVQTPEVYHSAGDLKLQPDVGGDVVLFGDTDVDNGENGKMLYVRRQAAEGNEYMRFYITSSQKGMIHTSADLTMQGQSTFLINSVTDDIMLKVGDNAGAKKVYVKDSDGTEVAYIDSNGDAQFDGDLNVGGVAALPAVETDAVLFPGGSTVGQSQLSPFEWHIGNAKHEGTKNITAETDGPSDVCFKPDGSKFYVVDNQLDQVFEYDLSTAWDVSTASYNSANFSTVNCTGPSSLFFRPDGKSMFIGDSGTDAIHEYALSSAWDITSASWTQEFDCSTWDGIPIGLHFRPDGRRMYLLGGTGDDVTEFVLSTAWDISTANYTQEFGTNIDNPEGLSFNPDGSKMYVTDGSAEDDIHEFELSYPWDVSTAVLTKLFHIWEDTTPTGITFRPNGTRMYVLGNNTDSIYEYHLGIVCPGNVAIGHSGEWGSMKLDVRDEMDAQAFFADTTAMTTEVGGGVAFGGKYNTAGDMALAGRIRASKSNATENNYDFDMTFEVQNTANAFDEAMRITSEGFVGIDCDPLYPLDVNGDGIIARFRRGGQNMVQFYGDATSTDIRFAGTKYVNRIGTWIDKPFSIVANSTEMATFDPTANDLTLNCLLNGIIIDGAGIDNIWLGTARTGNGNGDIIIGPSNAANISTGGSNIVMGNGSGDGLSDDSYSIIIGADCGNEDMEDNNILIGYQTELPSGVDSNGMNIGHFIFAGQGVVRIGGTESDAMNSSAALEVKSTTGAFLPPRMTTTQRNNLTPVNGMIIYNTSTNAFNFREGGSWVTK